MKATCIEVTENSFIVESENQIKFELPIFIYKDYNLIVGEKIEGSLRIDKRKNMEFFEPNHPIYKINDIVDFPVIGFATFENKTYINVEDCFGNHLRVNTLKWQNPDNFINKVLKCKVNDIRSGKPLLINMDYTHPIYKIGNEYDFEVIDFDIKILKNGNPLNVIRLKGVDNCIHETPVLPGQFGHKFKPQALRCKVLEITNYVKLEQTSFKDPYFAKIEDIINVEPKYIQKYFYELKNEEKFKDLFLQYESTNSLWSISYCNKVLPEIIFNLAYNFNFKEAIKITQILLQIENWILNSGLINSFKKEQTKEQIKLKSSNLIEKYQIMNSVFEFIQNNNLNLSQINDYNKKTLALAYYLRFNKKELIDIKKLFSSFVDLIKQNSISPINKFELNNLIEHVEYQKNILKNDDIETDFAIGEYNRKPFNTDSDLYCYLKFTLIQSYLSENNSKRNKYLGEFYKYLIFHFKTDLDKKNVLKLAYQIITSQSSFLELDLNYLNKLDDIDYIAKVLMASISERHQLVNREKWGAITKKYKENNIIPVRLKQRTVFGYIGYYENIYCILPKAHINSTVLKHYNEVDCDIIVNTLIQDTYYNFGTIIVKELPITHHLYKIENALAKEIETGDVINGRVKNITDFGVFLSTFAGEGLLHIQNITDLYIPSSLNSVFKIGEEIQICVLEKNKENKFEFGLKQLRGTQFEDSLDEIEFRIYSPNVSIDFSHKNSNTEISALLSKQLYIQGHIFEYFSNLQYDFEGKIKYLKLSKIYYSAILSSRSYFLNTYISYFEILKSIEETLDKKSIDSLSEIITNASSLLIQLEKNTKTIEKYPSIYRLLFFLDILKDFNNVTNDSIRKLSNYLLNEKYNDFPILNKVAKVVLSNNLIISEKYDLDYLFKNLRILFQYLKDGVFDISENEREREERELKERIARIRTKIFNEESEKVEFKSSLIKPILDNVKSKRLSELNKNDDPKSNIERDNLIGKSAKNKIIHSAMKTLVAFANSKGGTLFIGINDEGEFIGLNSDYQEIGDSSRDVLGQKLDEYINNYIGNSFFGLVTIEFASIDQKDILIIEVKPSVDEVFLIKNENGIESSDFYIRRHSSSVMLTGKELLDYYKLRSDKVK